MSLTAKTTTGVLWNFGQQLATRGVGILVTLLLARFLVPEDFGLVAMMAVFLALGSSLMDSGFREALIRLENITQEDYATAFYANLVLGLVSYGALFAAAPAIAEFYEEPRLLDLIRIASLSVIIMSFQVVQVASLSRKLNFKAQLKASLPASVISGVIAVGLAYVGWGVWALVSQTLLNALVQTALLWKMEGWRPTRKFSWSSLKGMYSFGYKLFLAGILNTIFQNIYIVVIAKIYSAPVSGLYFLAEKIRAVIIQQLVFSLQSATYPALAKIQGDERRLKTAYKKIVVIMSVVLFPLIMLAVLISEPLFSLVLEEDWIGVIPYFQILCIASLTAPLSVVNLNILKVKGRSDLFLIAEVVKKVMIVIALALTFEHGVMIIVIGQAVVSVFSYFVNSLFSKRVLGYGYIEQAGDFYLALIISVASAAISYWISIQTSFSHASDIILLTASFGFVYVSLSMLINKEKFVISFGVFPVNLKKMTFLK